MLGSFENTGFLDFWIDRELIYLHGFWVASLQVWPRWALTVIRFVEKCFTYVKDPKKSGQSLVAALQSRPPLTLTINTIRDYVSMYITLHTTLRHFTPLRYMYLRSYLRNKYGLSRPYDNIYTFVKKTKKIDFVTGVPRPKYLHIYISC